MADKPFAYGPNNPHPLLQMCVVMVKNKEWEVIDAEIKKASA